MVDRYYLYLISPHSQQLWKQNKSSTCFRCIKNRYIMKLRSPESFWLLKNGILHNYPSLQKNITCDIAVIGSGITGALISHTLHNAGYKTVVIDKRDVANGSSAATTSMLQYEIDVPMHKLAGMIGEQGAVECYRAGIDAIDTLESLVKKEHIDTGFARKKSLQVAHSKKAIDALEKEYQYRKKHGFQVAWLTSEEIKTRYRMESHPGILSGEGASIDAFRAAHELIKKNHERGMEVYDHTWVNKFSYGVDGVEMVTEEGYTVSCKKIIFCSGFETLQMFKQKYADVISTFALVSEADFNLYPLLKDVLIWDTAEPYIYMRTTDDQRLLVGGEDIPYKYSSISEKIKSRKTAKLNRKMKDLFPSLRLIEDYSWAGAFGVTKDGLPYIGTHPDFPGAIFVLGLGGNGITFSVQGMELVLKILAGETDPLLHYYRFDR